MIAVVLLQVLSPLLFEHEVVLQFSQLGDVILKSLVLAH